MSVNQVRGMVGNDRINAGDAVGVSSKHWFVAIVNNNTERQCSVKLGKLGYECYIPIQTETRIWRNGRKKDINRIIFPAMIFIHVTEGERKQIVTFPFIKRFMTNGAGKKAEIQKSPIAIIPDEQLETLRFMLDNSDAPVTIESAPMHLGDQVRIIRGKLQGLEGNIIYCKDGSVCIVIQIDLFGCAKIKIDKDYLELSKKSYS